MLNELSLFSGAGGGLLGTSLLGFTHVGYVEKEEYNQKIIAQRIKEGYLNAAPIYNDIETFNDRGYADEYKGMAELVTIGFPCQPHSTASRGKSPKDTMWTHAAETVKRVQPTFVLCENVSKRAIEMAERDLHAMGYFTRKTKISAKDLGADHNRIRYWLLAYTDHESELLCGQHAEMEKLPLIQTSVWETFPDYSGMVDGDANRVDRFKAAGNAQIPAMVVAAWYTLTIPQLG